MGLVAGVTAALVIASIWPAQLMRIALRTRRKGQPLHIALWYGWYTMVSFSPQMLGQFQYIIDRWKRRSVRLIEYKGCSPTVSSSPVSIRPPTGESPNE
jgi:hypothetical protein